MSRETAHTETNETKDLIRRVNQEMMQIIEDLRFPRFSTTDMPSEQQAQQAVDLLQLRTGVESDELMLLVKQDVVNVVADLLAYELSTLDEEDGINIADLAQTIIKLCATSALTWFYKGYFAHKLQNAEETL